MSAQKGEVIVVDTEGSTVTIRSRDGDQVHPMQSAEAFAAVSRAWLRAGWDVKYLYTFTWFGRPMLQLPEDMIRLQELIWQVQPDVIVETGVAHGGSLVFNATLCRALGKGRVIGVERGLYPQNRAAISAHPLADLVEVIEGGSTDPDIVQAVRSRIAPNERVLVILDSNHSRAHVLDELRAYGPMVSSGSYMIACDGIIGQLANARAIGDDWASNNPTQAVQDFLTETKDFKLVTPAFLFNESSITDPVTYWPGGTLLRL